MLSLEDDPKDAVKITRNRYQQGSIRKVPRAKGFAWEYRYYVTLDGKRKLKMQTFSGKLYTTEADVRRAVGAMVPGLNDGTLYSPSVAVTFGNLLDRYMAEEMPSRKSTRDSYTSIIKNHLRPRWENMVLSDIRPALIHSWFQSLKLHPVSKGHVRSLMRRLFELATLWEYLPMERRNPVELVKIKGVTKRAKEPVVISHEQFRAIVPQLPAHVNMVAVVSACLGLRVSETLGLRWRDIDLEQQTISIRTSAYRGAIEDTKTLSSNADLPLDPRLEALLERWKSESGAEFEWLFANPATGMPYYSPSLQQKWIRPAGESIGIKGLGFHSLRHSYRSWLDSAGTTPGVSKDLMRHSTIGQTFKYGRAMSEEKRVANSRVVKALLVGPKTKRRKNPSPVLN
jgi:integrase